MGTYATVTELPGSGATAEQLAMLAARYQLAAALCTGRDVLEVACGPGIGLGLLARRARRVVGGDYDAQLVALAKAHYGRRVPVIRFDARALPVRSESFDVVILFEALYYLERPEAFVQEARRVLRPQGMLVISTVNREWEGFNPSPYAHRYLGAAELRALLGAEGFAVEILAGFPDQPATRRDRIIALARRAAVAWHLVPPTMKGKAVLKRLAYGRLTPIPAELGNGAVPVAVPVQVEAGHPARTYKVLYAVGRKAAGAVR